MDIRSAIEQRLTHLNLDVFEFADDSHLHAGHAGNRGGGHYRLLLVSSYFVHQNRVKRQRIVQEALRDLFSDGKIHALSIQTLTPDEYFN